MCFCLFAVCLSVACLFRVCLFGVRCLLFGVCCLLVGVFARVFLCLQRVGLLFVCLLRGCSLFVVCCLLFAVTRLYVRSCVSLFAVCLAVACLLVV